MNFVWLFEHMLLLVECVRYVCFVQEEWEGFFLYLFIDRTTIVIHRMISTTDDMSDITRYLFSVPLVFQMDTRAF
jgi:hypothetical protein